MHEIRLNVQESHIEEVARLAVAAGVGRVNVYDVFVYGPNESRKVASIETSTPRAKVFSTPYSPPNGSILLNAPSRRVSCAPSSPRSHCGK